MQVRGWVPYAATFQGMPGSATPEEQLARAGIDMSSIAAARDLIAGRVG